MADFPNIVIIGAVNLNGVDSSNIDLVLVEPCATAIPILQNESPTGIEIPTVPVSCTITVALVNN